MSVEIYLFKSYSHYQRKPRPVLPRANQFDKDFCKFVTRFKVSEIVEVENLKPILSQGSVFPLSKSFVLIAGEMSVSSNTPPEERQQKCIKFNMRRKQQQPSFPGIDPKSIRNCVSFPLSRLLLFLEEDSRIAVGRLDQPQLPVEYVDLSAVVGIPYLGLILKSILVWRSCFILVSDHKYVLQITAACEPQLSFSLHCLATIPRISHVCIQGNNVIAISNPGVLRLLSLRKKLQEVGSLDKIFASRKRDVTVSIDASPRHVYVLGMYSISAFCTKDPKQVALSGIFTSNTVLKYSNIIVVSRTSVELVLASGYYVCDVYLLQTQSKSFARVSEMNLKTFSNDRIFLCPFHKGRSCAVYFLTGNSMLNTFTMKLS